MFRKFLVSGIKCENSIYVEDALLHQRSKIISEKGPVIIPEIDESYPNSKTTAKHNSCNPCICQVYSTMNEYHK